MAAGLIMIFPSGSTETSPSPLLSLMSQTLPSAQHLEPTDYESVALIRKTSSLHLALTQIIKESSTLRERCVQLAQKASEVQELGDGKMWKIGRKPTGDLSLQLLSAAPKKMRLDTSFSLIFRVIDKDGTSVKLRSKDIFELKVVASKTNISKNRRSSTQPPLSIIGTTRVFPTVNHEVAFSGISLTVSNAPLVGIKVWLGLICANRPEIKPFQLQPFVIRPSDS